MIPRASIIVGGINVAANPHPAGTYLRLIRHVVDRSVWLGGSDYATITAPTSTTTTPGDIYHGRICVWTEIDKSGDWLDKKTKQKVAETDKKSIVLPEDKAPNARFFLYAIDVSRHLLIYEMQNDVGQRFGGKRAERFFTGLFADLPDDFPSVDITLIPEEGTVDRILNMPKLRHLKIVVTRPNSEDLNDDFDRVYKKMEANHAATQVVEYAKQAKADRLTPDDDTRTLARIAAVNGYVEGKSRDTKLESTKEHPKQIPLRVSKDGSTLPHFLEAIRSFFTKPKE